MLSPHGSYGPWTHVSVGQQRTVVKIGDCSLLPSPFSQTTCDDQIRSCGTSSWFPPPLIVNVYQFVLFVEGTIGGGSSAYRCYSRTEYHGKGGRREGKLKRERETYTNGVRKKEWRRFHCLYYVFREKLKDFVSKLPSTLYIYKNIKIKGNWFEHTI